jgi:hypothetical protein
MKKPDITDADDVMKIPENVMAPIKKLVSKSNIGPGGFSDLNVPELGEPK